MQKKSFFYKFVQLFIVIAIFVVLLGKLFFQDSDGILFLLLYGILVTVVLWGTFLISFRYYRDPYEVAGGGRPKVLLSIKTISLSVAWWQSRMRKKISRVVSTQCFVRRMYKKKLS